MLSHRTLNLLALAAIAGLLASGAVLFWQLLGHGILSSYTTTVPHSPQRADSAVAEPAYQLDSLIGENLFGQIVALKSSPPPPKPRPNNVRKRLPPLNAKVLGIVQGSNGEGVAILSYRGKQQAYKTGEFLNMDESVLLEKVEAGKVYLKRGEHPETLVLEAKKNTNPINSSPGVEEQGEDSGNIAEALNNLKKRAIQRVQARTKPLNSSIKVQHNRSHRASKNPSL
ncbi:type II secretion system protein N [Motiliproteus sp. MSK22-1]|uniref:type II secretion system protein N n=1 Tax=Motiliproteus sp. MSK22-1 TaxID=1897630 RepID=UPI001E62088E|nr:type II secretion system protein N [Motiliproteus sp. MSK22-1]